MYAAVLLLFPNLELFYPVNLTAIDGTLKFEYLPDNCPRELKIADECIQNATNGVLPKDAANLSKDYFFTNVDVLNYQHKIVNSHCLKHTSCPNVVFLKNMYEKLTPIINTIYDSAKSCWNGVGRPTEIVQKVGACDVFHLDRKSAEFMMLCSQGVIHDLGCDKTEVNALSRAIQDTVAIRGYLLNPSSLIQDDSTNGSKFNHVFGCFIFVFWFWF